MQTDLVWAQLFYPKLRLSLGMSALTENPLIDWGNHLNYGFIFFLGFAITAAEQHGLGSVMHHARWKYLVLGFVLTCLRAVIHEIMPLLGAPDWTSHVGSAILM